MFKKIMTILCGIGISTQIFAQKEEISMKPILTDAGKYIQQIEMEMGLEIVRMEFDILQTTKLSFRSLDDNFEYGIFAFGDFRISDIDVKVYRWANNQWTLVGKDDTEDGNALVTIKPFLTGEYKIEISVYKFEPGYTVGHYGLLIYHN